MSAAWHWPGSRWWRVDLHAHSPASHDFGRQADREHPPDRDHPHWEAWVIAARDAGLHAVAVTDHHTAAGVAALQHAAANVAGSPVLFPGVEVTASDGVPVLVLMDPGRTERHVEAFLSAVGIPVHERGDETARSPLSVAQILERGTDDALMIGARVNRPGGLLAHGGRQRIAALRHARLAAVEADPDAPLDESWIDGSKPEIGRRLPRVWNSDGHDFDQFGRRFTWIKMTRPDLDGLRLALLDGDDAVRPAASDAAFDPNEHAASTIESVTVRQAKYLGKPQPVTIPFNPWLNTIIGGRGTGKSTLVDFCRTALRRERELDAHDELSRALQQRLRVPQTGAEEGLLTHDTAIELIYRKDGERFALSWDRTGSVPSIARCDGEARIPEDGDIRERFPVRIYSQKQLFEVARKPESLLTFIDDSDAVQGARRRRRSEELATRYLALRAQARALRAAAADLPARSAALADVRRKLSVVETSPPADLAASFRGGSASGGAKLAVVNLDVRQTGGHESALKAYRKYRRHDGAWQAIRHNVAERVTELGRAVEELAVADLDPEVADAHDPATAALRSAHQRLVGIVHALQSTVRMAIATAEQGIGSVATRPDDPWRQAVEASERAYDDVSRQLEGAGIASPAEYRDLLDRQAALQREIAQRMQQRTAAEEREESAVAVLEQYRAAHAELSSKRQQFATQTSGDLVRIRIDAAGDRANLAGFLRETLAIERFDQEHAALAEHIAPRAGEEWTWRSLDNVAAELQAFVAGTGPWSARDRRFEQALQRLQPERLDRLALYVPQDSVTVSFRDQRHRGAAWQPLALGSPGQQTAALLAFVLGCGAEPIILDQPEDDLDNTLIYELLVRRLREQKAHRQIIVVTHSPNIVVHGDAELVVSLETRNGQARVAGSGGLQERAVRDEVCRVMEGGREAFLARYRRIMPSDQRN